MINYIRRFILKFHRRYWFYRLCQHYEITTEKVGEYVYEIKDILFLTTEELKLLRYGMNENEWRFEKRYGKCRPNVPVTFNTDDDHRKGDKVLTVNLWDIKFNTK